MNPTKMFKVEKKILLMGRKNSGKTSMKSVIFNNHPPDSTVNLPPTMNIKISSILFRNNIVLNIWDCGGHEGLWDTYFVTECDKVFRNAHCLVYVFDVNNPYEVVKEAFNHFYECINAIFQYSPTAHVFCIINKMDQYYKNNFYPKKDISEQYKYYITNKSKLVDCTYLKSSIWDLSVYKAWSKIVLKVLPNIQPYDIYLQLISENIGFDEVLMCDRSTLLPVANFVQNINSNSKFQKLFHICVNFKNDLRSSISDYKHVIWIQNSEMCTHYAVIVKNFDSETFIAFALPPKKKVDQTVPFPKKIDCNLFLNPISSQENTVSNKDQSDSSKN